MNIQNSVYYFILWSVVFLSYTAKSQHVELAKDLNIHMDSNKQVDILSTLNDLIGQVKSGIIDDELIDPLFREFSKSVLLNVLDFDIKDEAEQNGTYSLRLVNLYPLSEDEFSLTLLGVVLSTSQSPTIKVVFELIAKEKNGEVMFASSLANNTKAWDQTEVGNIAYYHSKPLNIERASKFDQKNTIIANKMGQSAEKFHFFMTENFQEILRLWGVSYYADENGKYRDGYGVADGCIFAIMNNEDFSHDIFHYYSGKINQRTNRNWITEEGVAYSWGNAYYTDSKGNMIDQGVLVKSLARYLIEHPSVDPLDLFLSNQKIFTELASEVSPRSLMSSLLCDEVERKYGMEGLNKLINCGGKQREKMYFQAINELLRITKENFNSRIKVLINDYSN